MKRYQKVIALLCVSVLAFGLFSGCAGTTKPTVDKQDPPAGSAPVESESNYPTKDINASVIWGAGGACDSSFRAIAPHAEKLLGKTIIVTNRSGGGGAIAMQYVSEQPADGYNLLIGSEGAYLNKVLKSSTMDLTDFECINIYAGTYGVVLVPKDSPYTTLNELVDAILAAPGKIKMATAGPSSSPFAINAMMTTIHKLESNQIAFDGDSAAVTAVLGGEVDYTAVSLTSAMQYIKSGDIKALAVINDERLPGLEDVPAVTELYKEYSQFLPWGTFWGVWVKSGTPSDVVEKLNESFSKAAQEDEFNEFLQSLSAFPLNLTGDAAAEYANSYQSVTSWLIYDSGADVVSPADFNIPKP